MFSRLTRYLDSIRSRDPAPRSRMEVMLYPGVLAIGMHRVAHRLYRAEMFFFARFINHMSRAMTAIDIHPGAKIGRHLFIDHGFVTIGETAEIGNNVTIYPCATLGGTNPTNGVPGKRHPTLQDNVIVGSGAQILGPIVIGERARIGANAVVTDDVPEGATMVGLKARSTLVPVESWQRDFVPYGTPCKEPCEPNSRRVEELEEQLVEMKEEIALLRATLIDAPAPKGRKRSGAGS